MSKELVVRKIEKGTVIDHIPSGQALNVLRILGIRGGEGYRVAIVMNVESKKIGMKDIVKVEGKEISLDEVNKIALIAPTATINIIRDYQVVKKEKVELPSVIVNIVRCTNPNCVTNQPREPVTPRFKLTRRNPLLMACEYCGHYMTSQDVLSQFA